MKISLNWRRRVKLSLWERRRPLILTVFFGLAASLAGWVLGLPLGQLVMGYPVWGWIMASGLLLMLLTALAHD